MPSLLDTTVTTNYLKTLPTTQFGTRALRFICVTVSGVDLAADSDMSNSLYTKAVRALQVGAEVYAVLAPSATQFVAIISDDTVNDSDVGTNVPGGFGDLEAVILAAMGTGTVVITTGTWAGNAVTFA
jgi:hypothetical protein